MRSKSPTFHFARSLCLAAGAAVLVGLWPSPAADAQGVQRIAAIVNDELISDYDLQQRIQLLLATAASRPTPETIRRMQSQVLDALIDERVQLQEAVRLNLTVSDAEIENAIRSIEARFELPEDGLARVLERGGATIDALHAQLRGQIAWNKVIGRRLRPRITVGQDEIDEVLARMQSSEGQSEHRLSEILIALEGVDDRDRARDTAQGIVEQFRAGASFPDLARQFSQAVSAGEAGEVGWVRAGQMREEIDRALSELGVGDISDPIETIDGFYIILVQDRRQPNLPSENDIKVTIKQVFFTLAADAGEATAETVLTRARAIGVETRGCDNLDAVIADVGTPESGDLGTIALGDTPAHFRSALAKLAVGEASEPIRTETGVHVLMVCDRDEPVQAVPDRLAAEDSIVRTRLSMLARRYLRDLRRDAVVEFR